MEENFFSPLNVDGILTGMRFSLASHQQICTSSISDCPISHPSQLANPFLGLPLESGKCESCGTAEPGKCDGHFGYIDLPIPVFHPCHVSELRRLLDLVCLKCLRMKKGKVRQSGGSERSSNTPCSYCPDVPQISIKEVSSIDGAISLDLKLPSRSRSRVGFWNFLERYGFRYGDDICRTLLPCEVLEILKRIPEETMKKLTGKGYFPQDGYILQKLPVPPNCLSVPDISDGTSIMSSDLSVSLLKKIMKQVEIIKNSRSGSPNFESHKVEVNDLQATIAQYLHARGTTKAPDIKTRYGISKDSNSSSTKAWLEKMRILFIRKGSGYSSRSVITGDAYKRVDEIGLPLEIARRITFEERVIEHNKDYLQKLVDEKMCLTYRDGGFTYSLSEGSKGHTSLQVGQVVSRQIMDGDIVFINRPPSTHKHSLQAFSVYIHNDHTVKINPLICAPLGADFDGDCVHLFYPQSLVAKAEVLELFSVEHQLLSSHSGRLNLQLANDVLLALKNMFKIFFLDKATAQQLSMLVSCSLPQPALLKANDAGSRWTVLQILQTALPSQFHCFGERHLIKQSEMLRVDFNSDVLQSLFDEIISSVFSKKGSKEALKVFNSLQPLLMETIFLEGYSVCLKDFAIPMEVTEDLQRSIQDISPLLHHLRCTYNELVELQVENHLRSIKVPTVNFILKYSALGNLIDSKSESSITKAVQQLGFLGLQLSNRGKLYSRTLVEDMTLLFERKYAVSGADYPSEAFGLIKSCFFHGLNPFEEMVHSISSREVLVRSSRGLTEPGTLFKNLMAILRDVVVCYDGTVRNVCSNSVIQFEYGVVEAGNSCQSSYPAGEPVGVLAATAISNPAYKAVLDSSASSNSSWGLMKEILLCRVNFKNDLIDRRVILYLNACGCGKKYCKENASYLVRNQLEKVTLKDIAVNFFIEYQKLRITPESSVTNAGFVGHVHFDKKRLKDLDRTMHEVLLECQETINSFRKKKKKLGPFLKRIVLSVSECCCFQHSCDSEWSESPCLQFSLQDVSSDTLEEISQIMANMIYPILLETIVKGDPRVNAANIIWISPDMSTWVRNPCRTQKGELALEIILEKAIIKQNGDAWRIVLDSCLPVIHLIDIRRSIPYAIKQVQEALGLSCAFDQTVQRLSAAVSLVAKGVLKEHLVLVANSMTCTGNLIGFNTGGYKALFRSLNVQVPFTEATLFTPRKCFERAAEKCHIDFLSSIVASCSWGKHVTVGTGTRFEILWNKKEMGLNQDGVMDVYNYLQLVRSSSNEQESNTPWLGGEIDDLDLENGQLELSLSPEQDTGYGRPIFDESLVQDKTLDDENTSESNWEINSSLVAKSGRSREWKVDQHLDLENTATRPGWGTDDVQTQASPSTKPSPRSGGWNTQKWSSQTEPCGPWGKQADENIWEKSQNPPCQSGPCDAWGKSSEQVDTTGWNKNDGKVQLGQRRESHVSHSTKILEESPSYGGWNSKESQKLPSSLAELSDVWGKREVEADTTDWNKHKQVQIQPNDWSENEGQNLWGQQKEFHVRSYAWDTNVTREHVKKPTSSLGWDSSNAGEWKLGKSGSGGKLSEKLDHRTDWNKSGIFTATKQRLDQFTSEEQSILADVEPIMLSIKRIMQQSRYNDDDPLSPDDQLYVLDNVFTYHPDKAVKMGTGVDYVMVSKHSSFQDSRCFYIVSTDGRREDFSYRKCMENFVKEKYPGMAESFNAKYLRKPPCSGGGRRFSENREQQM